MGNDCIFCKINNREIKSPIPYSNNTSFAIKDIAPKAPIHFLIIPKIHLTNFTDFADQDFDSMKDMFKLASEIVKQENISHTGYRLVINQGSDAGQQVPHLHLHLLAGIQLGEMG